MITFLGVDAQGRKASFVHHFKYSCKLYGNLAIKEDSAVLYVSTALKVVPLLALEYTDAAIAADDSLGTVSMVLNLAPHIASAAIHIAQKSRNIYADGSGCVDPHASA